jgi:hypothetical protein
MARAGSSDLRFEDYEYELERESPILDENGEIEDYDYECITLFISGNYDPGEAPSWGYYGGCPGAPADVEIFTIEVEDEDGKRVKWDGTLDKDEERQVCASLREQAEDEIRMWKEDAAAARAGLD